MTPEGFSAALRDQLEGSIWAEYPSTRFSHIQAQL